MIEAHKKRDEIMTVINENNLQRSSWDISESEKFSKLLIKYEFKLVVLSH